MNARGCIVAARPEPRRAPRRNPMSPKASLVTMIGLVCCSALLVQAQERQGRAGGRGGRGGGQEAAQPPATDKVTPEIPGVLKAGTKIEIVASGLRGSDAGVGLADGSFIATGNGGGSKCDTAVKMTTLVEDSEQAAGLAMDPKGRLIGAQYTKKVSVLWPHGSEETLTSSFDGKPYIRPNDLVVDRKGGVYFTDCYQIGAARSPDDLPQSVYYITPNKKVIRVADDVRRPNGIVLSPDDKTLYVNDWDAAYLVAYGVQGDGTLKNRKNFAKYDLKQETDHGLVAARTASASMAPEIPSPPRRQAFRCSTPKASTWATSTRRTTCRRRTAASPATTSMSPDAAPSGAFARSTPQ